MHAHAGRGNRSGWSRRTVHVERSPVAPTFVVASLFGSCCCGHFVSVCLFRSSCAWSKGYSTLFCAAADRPIFEQARLYELAARAAWFLFHGSLSSSPGSSEDSSLIQSLLKPCYPRHLAGLLLSRRTRGKMFDRLLIDVRHLHLAHAKAVDEKTKCQAVTAFRQQMQDFCVFHLRVGARSSTLGFSTLREITQRLKTPFATLLFNTQVVEAAMLGMREQKDFSLSEPTTASTSARKTNEWEPRVDSSVANSLTDATTAARGTRTAFVNYEDNDSEGKEVSQSRSMNVEEYAKDLYKTGRLPVSGDDECGGGGWEGWADDEGRVLRTLFRIICGAPIFGADFGCQRMMATDPMRSSIFLTPYQQTPYDLHVAYQKFENRSNAFSKLDSRRNSFYQRRYSLIVALRERLSRLNGQELSDAVFDSVTSRLHYLHQASSGSRLGANSYTFGGRCRLRWRSTRGRLYLLVFRLSHVRWRLARSTAIPHRPARPRDGRRQGARCLMDWGTIFCAISRSGECEPIAGAILW
jgi:hypothetical protein